MERQGFKYHSPIYVGDELTVHFQFITTRILDVQGQERRYSMTLIVPGGSGLKTRRGNIMRRICPRRRWFAIQEKPLEGRDDLAAAKPPLRARNRIIYCTGTLHRGAAQSRTSDIPGIRFSFVFRFLSPTTAALRLCRSFETREGDGTVRGLRGGRESGSMSRAEWWLASAGSVKRHNPDGPHVATGRKGSKRMSADWKDYRQSDRMATFHTPADRAAWTCDPKKHGLDALRRTLPGAQGKGSSSQTLQTLMTDEVFRNSVRPNPAKTDEVLPGVSRPR